MQEMCKLCESSVFICHADSRFLCATHFSNIQLRSIKHCLSKKAENLMKQK